MKLSKQGFDFLASIEGCRLKPYDDQTGQTITHWCEGATIGHGHLISKREWMRYKDGITEEQAGAIFMRDLSQFESAVNRCVEVGLLQHQYDALVMLAYNIGIGNFKASSVLKLVNDAFAKTSYDGLEGAWKAWKKSQGKLNQGLVNRRKAEWNIYLNGVYQQW